MSNENLRDTAEDESDDSESESSEEGRGSSLVTFFNNLVSGGRLVFFIYLFFFFVKSKGLITNGCSQWILLIETVSLNHAICKLSRF